MGFLPKLKKYNIAILTILLLTILTSFMILQIKQNPSRIYDPNFLTAIATALYVIFTYFLLKHEVTKHHRERLAVMDVKLYKNKFEDIFFYYENISDKIAKNFEASIYLAHTTEKRVGLLFDNHSERIMPKSKYEISISKELREYLDKAKITNAKVIIEYNYTNDLNTQDCEDVISEYEIQVNKEGKLLFLDFTRHQSFIIYRLNKNYYTKFKKYIHYF